MSSSLKLMVIVSLCLVEMESGLAHTITRQTNWDMNIGVSSKYFSREVEGAVDSSGYLKDKYRPVIVS